MKVVYCKGTASIPMSNGAQVLVREGEHWPADDPIVVGNPHLFTDDPRVGLSYTVKPAPSPDPRRVEQATARPGERRG
jgi:hypothetical protein